MSLSLLVFICISSSIYSFRIYTLCFMSVLHFLSYNQSHYSDLYSMEKETEITMYSGIAKEAFRKISKLLRDRKTNKDILN